MKKMKYGCLLLMMTLLLAGCEKTETAYETLNQSLEQENYIDITFGSEYHQSEVKLDLEHDRAVIPLRAKWGRPEYREGTTAGIYYGDEEGSEVFDTDEEITPELYAEIYLEGVRQLELTAQKIQDEDFKIRVTKSKQLEPFEQELQLLTGVVMKDKYELSGVELTFDEQCRLVQKHFELQEVENRKLQHGEVESENFVQEFSYDTKENHFERAWKKVKKEIAGK